MQVDCKLHAVDMEMPQSVKLPGNKTDHVQGRYIVFDNKIVALTSSQESTAVEVGSTSLM